MKPDSESRRIIRGKALRNRREPHPKIPARPTLSAGQSLHADAPASQAASATAAASGVPDARSVSGAADHPSSVSSASVSAATVPAAGAATSAKKNRKQNRRFRRLQAVLLSLLAVLGLCLYLGRRNAALTVTYAVPGQADIVETHLYGETVTLHEAVSVPGKTFICWEDAKGKVESRKEFRIYSNLSLTARYLPAFETEKHIVYLDTGKEGTLNPGGSVTVRDFLRILYKLLDTDETGSGRFQDVEEDDPCFEAAAYLKDLGILAGKQLRPDEKLTRGEMIKTLAAFYPRAEETHVFKDLKAGDSLYPAFCTAAANGWIASGSLVTAAVDETVTRGALARVMNHVLHRDAPRHLDGKQTGTVLDVVPGGDYYDDLVEAAISHSYRTEDGEEVWTDSKPLPVHEPGFFFSGVRLHCIRENGSPVVNTALGGLTFNANGEITTGDTQLDTQLWEILEVTIDPDTMNREEMLRAVYDYVVDNFTYIYGRMYAFGAEGWAVTEARRMLTNHGGNCYCYAALFYELARFVGYDAQLFSGKVSGEQYDFRDYDGNTVIAGYNHTPHAWVDIEIDGESYLFDAEYEYRSGGMNKMFMQGDLMRSRFGYIYP